MNIIQSIKNLQSSVANMQRLISKDKQFIHYDIEASRRNTSKAQKTADDATQLANTNTQSIVEAQQTITDMDIAQIETEIAYTDIDKKLRSIYGRDVARFFCKSQTISAFGATIGKLVEQGNIDSIDQVSNIIEDIRFEADVNNTFMELLAFLDNIRQRAPKIGVEQRLFLRLFFTELLNPKSTSYSKMMESSKVAFEKYIQTRWKSNTIEQ